MTIVRRDFLAAAAVLFPLLVWPGQASVSLAATEPRKTAGECNKELEKNREALEKAGETPQAFFHACWFDTKPGEPTPISSEAKPPQPSPAAGTAATHAAERVRHRSSRAARLERRRERRARYSAREDFEPRSQPRYEREPEENPPVQEVRSLPPAFVRPVITVGPPAMQPDDPLRLMRSSRVCLNLVPLAPPQACVNVPAP